MSGVDNNRPLDAAERAQHAQAIVGELHGEAVQTKQASRKEPSQSIVDKGIETLTYSLTAPALLQALHTAQQVRATMGHADVEAPVIRGVRLYALTEKELPRTIRTDPALSPRAGEYELHPNIARGADGKESVAYYTAVRHGRPEFAVGTDSVEAFNAHHDMYQQQADASWGMATARPYEQDTYRTGERVSNQDYKGAASDAVTAWNHACADPVYATQRAFDVAVMSSAHEHPAMRDARTASDVKTMPEIAHTPSDANGTSVRGRMYKPTTTLDPSMPAGSGGTDKYGNVTVSSAGTPKDIAIATSHEAVHSFLSPKAMNGLRELRANAGMTAYDKSQLCRYLEEALAETYAQVKVNGLSALPEGLTFPLREKYDLTLSGVIKEGAIGTVVYGGVLYGVYLAVEK